MHIFINYHKGQTHITSQKLKRFQYCRTPFDLSNHSHSSSLQETTLLTSNITDFFFLPFRLNAIIHHVSQCAWSLLFNNIFERFIPVVQCGSIYLFPLLYNILLCEYYIIYSSFLLLMDIRICSLGLLQMLLCLCPDSKRIFCPSPRDG